jgi:hypothetical protein
MPPRRGNLGIFAPLTEEERRALADAMNQSGHNILVAGLGGLYGYNTNNANMGGWGGAAPGGGGGGAAYVPPNTGYGGHLGSFSMAANRGRANTSLSEAAARGAGGAAGQYGPMSAFFGMNPAANSVAGLVGAKPATVARAMETNSRVGNVALAAAAAATEGGYKNTQVEGAKSLMYLLGHGNHMTELNNLYRYMIDDSKKMNRTQKAEIINHAKLLLSNTYLDPKFGYKHGTFVPSESVRQLLGEIIRLLE